MTSRRIQSGMTLIEMMIAILISMILSIAVMSVMSTFEGRRRTLGSSSDLDSAGSLAMYQLDRWIRSAGTGFVQANSYAYGCKIFAAKGGTQLLPATAALPAPFNNTAESAITTDYRLAPVVIVNGGTTPAVSGNPSDVLVVMAAGNGGSQVPTLMQAVPAATSLSVLNLTEFSPNDLILLADQQPATGNGPADCLVSQAAAAGFQANGTGTSLPLAGSYYAATVGTRSLANFTDVSMAINLGGTSANGGNLPPTFQVIGVGDNDTLYSYDLLGLTSPALQAQAEGVFEMHAVYGIDSTGNSNNIIDQWVTAAAGSAYSANKLTDGSAGASQLLKNIRAVRVGIIMRTALPERPVPGVNVTSTPNALTMFSDLQNGTITFTRPMTAAEKLYRYRVIETTIPVRNNQF